MRWFSVGYATKGVSFVVSAEGPDIPLTIMPTVVRMKDDPATVGPRTGKIRKADFLAGLKPGDVVYLELGGPSDRLALAARAYGATVFRYQTFLLSPERVNTVLASVGWEAKTEKPQGKETSQELTERKARALALMALAAIERDAFLPVTDQDLSILRIAAVYRSFKLLQRRSLATIQALLSAYGDRALIELALARQTAAERDTDEIYKRVVAQLARDLLGGTISEGERENFVAAIGDKFPDGRIPIDASEEDVERIVEAMLESDRFESTILDRLKSLKTELERLLAGDKGSTRGKAKRDPVPAHFLWEKVFGPIPGVGPLIAAPLIAEIADIRNYRSDAALKAAAGYHHFEDGTRARKVAGRVANWKPRLKQAVYLWTQQTLKLPGSSWRARLDRRRAYELYKILIDRHGKGEAHGYTILPDEWIGREIKGVCDIRSGDLAALGAIVDTLRKQAGVMVGDEEEGDDEGVAIVKDKVLAGLMAGVKGAALNKALRWLGQQFLRHIYHEWRAALDLPRK